MITPMGSTNPKVPGKKSAEGINSRPPNIMRKPPSLWVFLHTLVSERVQGVRMPTNQAGRTRVRTLPITMNTNARRILRMRITSTFAWESDPAAGAASSSSLPSSSGREPAASSLFSSFHRVSPSDAERRRYLPGRELIVPQEFENPASGGVRQCLGEYRAAPG